MTKAILRFGVAAAAALVIVQFAAPAEAQSPSIEGSWSGGGVVTLATGDTERARCRASFSRSGANTFRMNAVCATPSVRVSQSASLQRTSANQLSGSFFNPEYNVSGRIRITVQGGKLSAQLSGDSGSASLSLTR
jgi:hypothetical protein